jgi:hypothetical protein
MRDGGRTLEYTLFGGKSLAPALVDGAYESDELPFALEGDAVEPPPSKNGSGRALGDLG